MESICVRFRSYSEPKAMPGTPWGMTQSSLATSRTAACPLATSVYPAMHQEFMSSSSEVVMSSHTASLAWAICKGILKEGGERRHYMGGKTRGQALVRVRKSEKE